MYRRKPFWLAATILLVLDFAVTENSLAQTGIPEEQRAQVYSEIETECGAEAARFCPAPDQSSRSPQTEAMCLKFYRPDLTFSCRKAIDAAQALHSNRS